MISERDGAIDQSHGLSSLSSLCSVSLLSYIGTTHDCSNNEKESKNVLVPKWAKKAVNFEDLSAGFTGEADEDAVQCGSVSTLFMALW